MTTSPNTPSEGIHIGHQIRHARRPARQNYNRTLKTLPTKPTSKNRHMLIAVHEFVPDWQPIQWASLCVLGILTLFCATTGTILWRKAAKTSASAAICVGMVTLIVTTLLGYIGLQAAAPLATVTFTDRELRIDKLSGTTRIPFSSNSEAWLTQESVVFESSGIRATLPRYAVWRMGNLPVDGRYLFNEFQGRSRGFFVR
jgi:hypothetical protein